MKKTILLIALALVSLGAVAGKKSKTATNAKALPAMETEVDTFSFAAGRANTMGLKDYLVQRMGIDTTYIADFLAGFDADSMTEADKRQKARLAGMEIRSQVNNQIMPQVANQINDTIDLLSRPLFVAGFRNGVAGSELSADLWPVSMDSTQTYVRTHIEAWQAALKEAKYGKNRQQGADFLAKNATAEGVICLPSGLQYKVVTQGDGAVPTAKQKVKVNYRGTLIDGTEFDSSYRRKGGATFTCNQVIAGWTEALTMMPVGSKWMLYIPQELAYGEKESGKIPPYSTLIFEVELLEIVK